MTSIFTRSPSQVPTSDCREEKGRTHRLYPQGLLSPLKERQGLNLKLHRSSSLHVPPQLDHRLKDRDHLGFYNVCLALEKVCTW